MSQKEKCIRSNAPGKYVPPDLRWLVSTTKSNSYIQVYTGCEWDCTTTRKQVSVHEGMAAFTTLLTLRRLRSIQRFGNWAKWIEQTQVFTHPSRTLSAFALQKKRTKKTKSLQVNGSCLELWPWSTCSHHHDSTTSNSLYDQTFAKSMSDPKKFWAEAAESLVWDKKWDKVLDDSNLPFSQW